MRELEALGEISLSNVVYFDMTNEQAVEFAAALRATATALDGQYSDSAAKPRGACQGARWNQERKQSEDIYSTFEEAIATIREAAHWYEEVGSLGFGVHAWC